jgi:hypothetical protein
MSSSTAAAPPADAYGKGDWIVLFFCGIPSKDMMEEAVEALKARGLRPLAWRLVHFMGRIQMATVEDAKAAIEGPVPHIAKGKIKRIEFFLKRAKDKKDDGKGGEGPGAAAVGKEKTKKKEATAPVAAAAASSHTQPAASAGGGKEEVLRTGTGLLSVPPAFAKGWKPFGAGDWVMMSFPKPTGFRRMPSLEEHAEALAAILAQGVTVVEREISPSRMFENLRLGSVDDVLRVVQLSDERALRIKEGPIKVFRRLEKIDGASSSSSSTGGALSKAEALKINLHTTTTPSTTPSTSSKPASAAPSRLNKSNSKATPVSYYCLLTGKIMVEPVRTTARALYDAAAIKAYMARYPKGTTVFQDPIDPHKTMGATLTPDQDHLAAIKAHLANKAP